MKNAGQTISFKEHQLYLLAILAFVMYLFVMPKQQHQDVGFWIKWATHIKTMGLRHAYTGTTDYLPLYLYVIWLYTKVQGTMENIVSNIYILKGVSLLLDFMGAIVVVRLVKDIHQRWLYFFFLVLNPIFIYNSYLWGQVDAFHSFFLLTACIAAYKGKPIWALPLYIIALNFKLHSIVYLPVVGLVLISFVNEKGYWLSVLKGLAIALFLQLAIIYPFWSVGDLPKLLQVLFGSVDHYPKLSLNAFNIWYWMVDTDPELTSDAILFAGIPAKTWGFIGFFSASFILLFPLFVLILKKLKHRISMSGSEIYLDIVLIVGALVTMNFFFFCTQMHERYCHVSMLFTCAFCLRNKKWGWMSLYFLAYFLNHERVYHYLDWSRYTTFIYEPRFIAVLWGIFMIGLYIELYKRILKEWRLLPVSSPTNNL